MGLTLFAMPAICRQSELLGYDNFPHIVERGNSSDNKDYNIDHTLKFSDVYDKLDWRNVDGKSFVTRSLNQHIPQYCGSCWAHAFASTINDRVKIKRNAAGTDIMVSVQHLLNCGNVGSCHGGTVDGPFQWLYKLSKTTGSGISYETSNPYVACSSESKEGFCPHVDTTCKPINIARTCGGFEGGSGGDTGNPCVEIVNYPNVTISEYGSIRGSNAMLKQLQLGPIACGIDAEPLLNYTGGVINDKGKSIDHVIEIVGYDNINEYWIGRNSWGEYWGEMGFFRVAYGSLLVERQCSWATIDTFTSPETGYNYPCYEDGSNCM
jgi:cathepsin X